MYFRVCATTRKVIGVAGVLVVFTNEVYPVANRDSSSKLIEFFAERKVFNAISRFKKSRL